MKVGRFENGTQRLAYIGNRLQQDTATDEVCKTTRIAVKASHHLLQCAIGTLHRTAAKLRPKLSRFKVVSATFDKVVHEGVFQELMDRGAPVRLLGIVEALLKGCNYKVRGRDAQISATTGVKQGSVLSPCPVLAV